MKNTEIKNLQDKISCLAEFVSEHKKQRISEVLDKRTRYLTLVLENIYQPHNISAVIRSCECFGIQDLHVIENDNRYKVNRDIALGSAKWIDVIQYNQKQNNTEQALTKLKQDGYAIAALTLSDSSIALDELPLDRKLALCIGTEETGLTDIAHEIADYHVKLPMHGFTQSFNLSVTAALCMHTLTNQLHRSEVNWHLTASEQDLLTFRWYCKMVKHSKNILKRYFSKH